MLQIMPQYPYPTVDGGKVSLAAVTRELVALGHTVHVVCYAPPGPREAPPEGATYHIVEYEPTNTTGRIAASMFSKKSLYVSKHDTPEIRAMLHTVMKDVNVDIVHADHTCMAPLARDIAKEYGKPWGLRLHNVEWKIWDRYAEELPRWHPVRHYVGRQARLVKVEESALIAQADVSFAISPVDRDRAQELAPDATVISVPAGVEFNRWKVSRDKAPQPEVIIATNYAWIHNVTALKWFVDDVWPLVKASVQNATLHVVGSNPPEFVKGLSENGVHAEGFVEDLAARYATARVSIAPLFVGSGIRLKILEAMASGLPVVATGVSAEGIDLGEDEGLYRRESASEYAQVMIELLTDNERWLKEQRAASSAIERKYAWKDQISVIAEHYKRLST